jgi:hypothetical protein
MLWQGTADEGRKLVKNGDRCHWLQCPFLCGVCRVVWRCEDVGSGATRWRHVILYWAYARCTICIQNMKPAIHEVEKISSGTTRHSEHRNQHFVKYFKYPSLHTFHSNVDTSVYTISTAVRPVTKIIICTNPWRSGIALVFRPHCLLAWGLCGFLSINMSYCQMRLYLKPTDRSRFILGTFRHFCRAKRFQRKWRPTEHWTALMHLYYEYPSRFNSMWLITLMRWGEIT